MDSGISADLPRASFGNCTLLSRLSFGGMAELFLAIQRLPLGVERLVVVKRILPSRRADPTFVEMFLREARIGATLSHPNVVQTLDAGEIDGEHFIVMEYVHGEDLRAIVRAVRRSGAAAVPLEHALHVALGVCAGLDYVHEKRDLAGERLGIVHGDVSAHNVVVSFSGDVKIVDFGIATSDWAEPVGAEGRRVKGKARYMSPEQAAGEALDARADVFSLGVVLFELTTGRRLFEVPRGGGAGGVARRAAYERPSDAVAGYPPGLERIVLRALHADRVDRYPSARDLQADLERFAREEGIVVSVLGTSAWMRAMFEEKLARGFETMRRRRELVAPAAASIPAEAGAEAAPAEGGEPPAPTASAAAAGGSLAPHAVGRDSQARRRRFGAGWVQAAAVAAALGAIVYVRHDASARAGRAARACRDELAARDRRDEDGRRAQAAGTLRVESNPEGAQVWIDGVKRSESTPAQVDGLAVGRELHVALAEPGFETYRTTVVLSADRPSPVLAADMKSVAATLLLEFPPAAPVEVSVDGKRWTGSRSKIDGLAPGHEHVVSVQASGGVTRSFHVVLGPGEVRAVRAWLGKGAPPP